MHLIDREIELLFAEAKKEYEDSKRKDYLREDKDALSYYIESSPSNDDYLTEYEFETPAELMEMLGDFFERRQLKKEMIPIFVASVFKMKDSVVNEEKLPDTIYNF